MMIWGSVYRFLWLLIVHIQMSYCWLACYSGNQTTLSISNQTFNFLNETALGNCPAVAYRLSVADNNIPSLTKMSFRKSGSCGFYSLNTLDLTNNQINSIGNETFSCLVWLKTLNLSYNNMTMLSSGIFDGLVYLEVLDLSYNSIQYIDSSVFGRGKLNYLTDVYLQNNELHAFEPWPYVLKKIILFDLRNNSISTFSNNIGWTYDLKEPYNTLIDLRDNNMTGWRDDFLIQYHPGADPTYDILTYRMDFRDNPWICDCHIHNIISYFQRTFFLHAQTDLVNLKCVTPYHLHNEDMLYIRQLKDLVCNVTANCPENCLCQKQPESMTLIVDCSRRGLTSLPQELPSIPGNYSYVLNFSYNSITKVEKRKYTDAIQTLDLQGNELQEIEALAISDTKQLEFIDLNNNNLKSIPSAMLKIVFEMTDLSNNPFVCDCDMVWMADWIKRSPIDTRGRNMTCTFEEEEQFTIMEITDGLLDCSYDLAIGLAVGFGVLLVVAVVAVIWAKRCPYETKVLLFKFCGFHPSDKYIVDRSVGSEHDVYVSFDDENIHIRQWVLMKLAIQLEPTYKMFIPIRDLDLGEDRVDETITHLEQSRRIIIVLSDGYDGNEWCEFECQRAEILDFNEGRIIYIKYHDSVTELLKEEPWTSRVNGRKVLSPGGTKSEKRWFWDKLKYELPVVFRKERKYCFSA